MNALFASVATLVLSATAFAQTTSAPAAPANKPPTTNPPAVSAPAQATEAATGTAGTISSATTSASGPTEGTNTAQMSTVVKKRPFKVDFFTRTSISAVDLLNQQNSPGTSNYLQVKVPLSDTKSVSVRQEFTYKLPKQGLEGDTAKGKGTVNDVFLGYTDSKLATFMGDGQVIGLGRVYLPTGESSRYVTKRKGMLLGELIASKPVSKFDLSYGVVGIYFNQSQNSIGEGEKLKALEDYELDHFVEASYNVTPKISIAQVIETDHVWNRSVDSLGGVTRDESFVSETYATLQAIQNLTFYLSVLNVIPLRNAERDFAMFRQEELSYRAAMLASF